MVRSDFDGAMAAMGCPVGPPAARSAVHRSKKASALMQPAMGACVTVFRFWTTRQVGAAFSIRPWNCR